MSVWLNVVKDEIKRISDLVNPTYLDDMSTDYLSEVYDELEVALNQLEYARELVGERIDFLNGWASSKEDGGDWSDFA